MRNTMRANPFSLKRPERTQQSREFTDPAQPGFTLTLTLREPNALDLANSASLGQEMIQRYVEGDGESEAFAYHFDGHHYRLTPGYIHQISPLVVMQPTTEELGYEPYSFEEMAGFSFAMPHAWVEIMLWARDILYGIEARIPNALAAHTGRSSGAPRVTDRSTPNSPTEQTDSSAASTNGSEHSVPLSAPVIREPISFP